MRLFKDDTELATMRRAAAISAAAHRARHARHAPGQERIRDRGRAAVRIPPRAARSFPPTGRSSRAAPTPACCTTATTARRSRDGDLLLIDAGCELDGYASDITRTFPVNGKFSGPQRDIYELVLAAQAAAIAKCRPGSSWNEPHDAAVQTLARGFVDLGLCEGPVERVIETEDYKRFYMHRTGHWLGLDVHDVGEYKTRAANGGRSSRA